MNNAYNPCQYLRSAHTRTTVNTTTPHTATSAETNTWPVSG